MIHAATDAQLQRIAEFIDAELNPLPAGTILQPGVEPPRSLHFLTLVWRADENFDAINAVCSASRQEAMHVMEQQLLRRRKAML